MSSQHTTETVTPVPHRRWPLDATPVTMYNALHGNVRPPRGQRSYQCATCLREFPASDVMLIDGRPYCRPYRHYLDPIRDRESKRTV